MNETWLVIGILRYNVLHLRPGAYLSLQRTGRRESLRTGLVPV